MDRRSFLKMVGVGVVAGPAVLAGGASKPAITSPVMMRFDVSRSPATATVALYGQTSGGDWVVLGRHGDIFDLDGIERVQVRGVYRGPVRGCTRFTSWLEWLSEKRYKFHVDWKLPQRKVRL